MQQLFRRIRIIDKCVYKWKVENTGEKRKGRSSYTQGSRFRASCMVELPSTRQECEEPIGFRSTVHLGASGTEFGNPAQGGL